MKEGVLRLVVGETDGLLESNGVDDRGRGRNVQHFHEGVVERIEGGEEVQVAGDKDEEKQFMCPHGNA
jgi:hypothetical protein